MTRLTTRRLGRHILTSVLARPAGRWAAHGPTRLQFEPLEDRAVPAILGALTPLQPVESLAYQASGTGVVTAGQSDSVSLDLDAGQTLSVAVTPFPAAGATWSFGGHYYTLTSTRMNWLDAEAEAVSLGGDLVTINSAEEQAFLNATFLSGANSMTAYWIGFTDRASEGTWVWASGEPVTYTNWHPAEPNNNGDEDYGVMNWHTATGASNAVPGDWNDVFLGGRDTGPTYGIIELTAQNDLQPRVTVTGPGGAVLGTADAGAVGGVVLLQTVPVASAGTYTINVSGIGASTGAFTTRVLLNAAAEAEQYGGAANDTRAAAQDLGNAVGLGGSARRLAAVGDLTDTAAEDWYSFALAAGESATLAVTSQGSGTVGVEAYDAAGTLLGTGDPAPTNVGAALTVIAPAAGTYFARLTGIGSYSLVVTAGALLELEDNSGPTPWALGPSQDLGGGGTALGAMLQESVHVAEVVPPGSGGLSAGEKVVLRGGSLYVVSGNTDQVMRYDAATGAPQPSAGHAGAVFAGGGLSGPVGLTFGPDGNLYVTNSAANTVVRFDGTTGALLGTFVAGSGTGLLGPAGLAFGPDDTGDGVGELFVSSRDSDRVMRYDGATGAPLPSAGNTGATFALGGGLDGPDDLTFGPDGNLYVSSQFTDQVIRYDGITGQLAGTFVSAGSGGLDQPLGLRFGPDGDLYVVSYLNSRVLRYQGPSGANPGAFRGTAVPQQVFLSGPSGLAFGPDGDLFVTNRGLSSVVRATGPSDFYKIHLAAGGVLRVEAAVPFAGPGQPVNALSAVVRVYDAAGRLVASDDGSEPGGRGAEAWLQAAAGDYFVRVASASGTTGPYVLTAAGYNTTSPVLVRGLYSPLPGGLYAAGQQIPVVVAFDNPVVVTGTPTLALNNGAVATYSGGSGTAWLTFTYTVAAGEDVAVLDAAGTTALALNGGSITSTWDAAVLADLTLPAPGGPGSLAAATPLAIDTQAPSAPAVAGFTTDPGRTTVGTTTNDSTPTLSGSAEAGSTVAVFDGGVRLGEVKADSAGVWTYTPPVRADGSHTFTATATDPAGNTSGPSPVPLAVTVDTTPPAAPAIADFSTDSGARTGSSTSDPTPMLSGTADAGSTVRVYDGLALVGVGQAGPAGAWAITTTALADGVHSLTATASDLVENTSWPSAVPLAVTIDTAGPVVSVAPAPGQPDPATAGPVVFAVTFSEPVSGLDAADLIVGGTTGATTAVVTGSGASYTVAVSGMTRAGTVSLAVRAGAVADALGNPSAAAAAAQVGFTPPVVPPPLPGLTREYAAGADAGGAPVVSLYNPDGTVRLTATPFPASFAGGVRVAVADVTGDGVPDVVAGTGPGMPTAVVVLDGATGAAVATLAPFEPAFTGGVYVAAADLDGDGRAEVVVTPDEGGGPRVLVYGGGTLAPRASFLGIDDPNFRGGARAALGDFDGDGRPDLAVAAGFGGGPRVTVWSNADVLAGSVLGAAPLLNTFVFETALRNGAFVALGDVTGDGYADLIAGGGPGGGPRVRVLDAKGFVSTGQEVTVANFFAGDTANRGGVRVAAKNMNGDPHADLVVGSGAGAGSRVTAYPGDGLAGGGVEAAYAFDALPGFTGGVFVG